MSGLAAYVRWIGQASGELVARRLLQRTPWRGDFVRSWADARASLATAAWTGPDTQAAGVSARDPSQPGTGDAVAVAFEGRLDNADALGARLGLPAGSADAAVALAAYVADGPEFVARLAGDFALVVWDARAGRVVAGRDPAGVRPLVYAWDPHGIACASDLVAVLALGDRPVNEGMVAEYLSERITSPTETWYGGVFRLAPAHVLVADAHGCRTHRYWTPDPAIRRGVSLDAWVGEWRDTFDAAVERRLAMDGPTALALSGGLDSSAILEAAVRRSAGGTARTVHAFTISRPGDPHDETSAARRVAVELGTPWTAVPAAAVEPAALVASVRATAEPPDLPVAVSGAPMLTSMRVTGHRRVLTGFGGDDWFYGTAAHTADLLAAGAWLRAGRWLLAERRARLGLRDAPRMAWYLVPPRGKRVVRTLLGRRATRPYIDPAFARRIDLEARLRAIPASPAFETRQQAAQFACAMGPDSVFHNELQERVYARAGLDEVRPFHDVRLITLALAMPEDIRRPGAEPKGLVRRALHDRLSPRVLAYRHEGDGTPVLTATLRTLDIEGRADALEPLRRGWIARGPFRALCRAAVAGHGASALQAWMVVAIDVWLREIGA